MTPTPADVTRRSPAGRGRSLALVKHLRSEGLTAIDAATHEPLGTVGEGRQPHAMAVHPAGRWAYVPYMASGTIDVIDLRGPSVTATVDAGTAPIGAALTRGGRYLLVGTYGPMSGSTDPGLMVFETNAVTGRLALVDRFGLGPCAGITITATNDAWVALKEGNQVVHLSGPPMSIRDRIDVPAGPQGVRYAPQYGLLGVDCVEADAVAFVDTTDGRIVDVVDAPNPRSGAVVPAHDRWFVSDLDGDGLTVVDLESVGAGADTERVPLGTPTAFTDAAPDGSLVVADASDDDRVTFLDPATLDVVARVRTGRTPHHAQFTADGRACYVPNTDDDTVSVLDTGRPFDAIEPLAEITVSRGAAPSGCYLTDRRIGG